MGPDQPKASPLAKRIARPPQGPPAPKAPGVWGRAPETQKGGGEGGGGGGGG